MFEYKNVYSNAIKTITLFTRKIYLLICLNHIQENVYLLIHQSVIKVYIHYSYLLI